MLKWEVDVRRFRRLCRLRCVIKVTIYVYRKWSPWLRNGAWVNRLSMFRFRDVLLNVSGLVKVEMTVVGSVSLVVECGECG